MIHRGVLSAMERLVAHLTEQYEGAFPPWLAPVQLLVLPVAEANAEQARLVAGRAAAGGLRAVYAPADTTLKARIRRAHDRRIPYIAVIGDREAGNDAVALRLRDGRPYRRRQRRPADPHLADLVASRSADLGFR